jgi:3-deoxy-D-manno-octulosonic-acid transferase
VLVASSTHPGEEQAVAAAHLKMREKRSDLLTIIVPRHPHRGPELAREIGGGSLQVALRSSGAEPSGETDIYIADTIGEMGLFYSVARVAFVGGSLVKRGGQNPIEAIKLGAAVLTGPSWQNFADAYDELLRRGGCQQVENVDALAAAALRLFEDEAAHRDMLGKAEAVVETMSGALPRTVAALSRFLPPEEPLRHAS